ncbi:MAG: 50S ribosomal protein L11 methyltransferase, partial [Hormoscilla sp.]
GYGRMIADKGRMDAYVKALRQAVTPESVVLDIGTGTGIFAMLACQFGAKKVYAIEPSDAIQVGKEIAAANGYGNSIEFIQKLSTEVELPEPADVIISDLRSILPPFQQHIPSIVDARKRLLAPGGILIPQADILWAAVVEAPHLASRIFAPWDENPYGLDMTAGLKIVTNVWGKGWVTPAQLLTPPQSWATLDYNTIENPDVKGEITWTVARSGTGHGLTVWFDATLAEGIGFSNGPGMPELVYSMAFFPWSKPVPLTAGDKVSVTLQANLVNEDYIWRWESRVFEQGDPDKVRYNFKQSTFFGKPLVPAQLHKQGDSYVPQLNQEGKIAQLILALMSEEKPLGEIARELTEKFPDRFPTWKVALSRVGEMSKRYSA